MSRLETELAIMKYWHDEFDIKYETMQEFLNDLYENPKHIGIGYTELGNENQFPVQITLDIETRTVFTTVEVPQKCFKALVDLEHYNTEDELTYAIDNTDFDCWLQPAWGWLYQNYEEEM